MKLGRMSRHALAALLSLAVATRAQPFRDRASPVPEGARVVLELDKKQFFLGENILLHYRLENTGKTPFTVSFGGDHRGASRHLRFTVRATGPDGVAVADPDPSGFCMGGMGASAWSSRASLTVSRYR
ncbi:MAG: hypothetical protein LC745_06680 [Planctomycetia bacterium]|nr:hypothetical protein [Planctomycetia bacterium]